jgi:hypothetical protein
MLTIGTRPPPASITAVAPLLLEHLGVQPPVYAQALTHA